jgi:hypothetical protein
VYAAAGKWTDERSSIATEELHGGRHHARQCLCLPAARQADEGTDEIVPAHRIVEPALAPAPRNAFVQKEVRAIEPMDAGNTSLAQIDESLHAIVCVHPVFLSGPTLPVHWPWLALY